METNHSRWGAKEFLGKFLLDDRVAIVTGGGGGIGKGIALGLAAAGAHVVIAESMAGRGEAAADEIRALGRRALPIAVDVTDRQDVQILAEKTMAEFGRLDILVNNVGGTRGAKRGPIMDTSEEVWASIIDINMTSTFLCSKMAAGIMTGQKSGNIVNIVSSAGLRPYPGQLAYGAAKAGVINFTQSLAVQLAPYNIRVNAIAPVITKTPGSSYLGDAEERAMKVKGILLRRAARVEDMAYAALFLTSDASEFITGHVLPLTGGPLHGLRMLEEAEADWKKK